MNSEYILAISASFCAITAIVIFSICRRKKEEGADVGSDDGLSENDHVFSGFIKRHEKRILAHLIEKEARARAFDMEKIFSLRKEYGTELVRPAYDAQDQLGKCGINPMEVTQLQKAWVLRNGGNPNAHPTTREVERILFARNETKALAICSGEQGR